MNQKRIKIVILISAQILLALLIIMQFTDELQLNEAIAYTVIVLLIGGLYEMWQWLKTKSKIYKTAFLVGLGGAFLLFWANGAIGIIGSEDNPANLLYGAVFFTVIVGSLQSRFRSCGMANTLFTVAAVQFIIPFFALFIWPAQTTWGAAGVNGVIAINTIFALIFVVSGLLFKRVK